MIAYAAIVIQSFRYHLYKGIKKGCLLRKVFFLFLHKFE